MDINLQVVGIFYNSTLSITKSSPKIVDLLDEARMNPGRSGDRNQASRFAYTTNTSGSKVFASSFLAKYDSPVRSRVLGQAEYPAGEYFLDEHLSNRPAYTVWQYYMFDSQGRYLNEFGQATPFGQQSLVGVPIVGSSGETADVARVIWRLVQILAAPTTPISDGAGSNELIAKGSPYTMRS